MVPSELKANLPSLAQLPLMAKWPSLATMPSLAKPQCNHHNYLAGVIAGRAGVVTFITSRFSQHCAGILTSPQWRVAVVAVVSLPL
jgi:hypothetical protein